MKKSKLQIIKIGGEVINNETKLSSFLKDFSSMKGAKILVHGGGRKTTEMAEKMGVRSEMVNGRRITNQANLDLATMVYAGLLNKQIIAHLQKFNCNALGLSGADANCISAGKRPVTKNIDYGFAGDINKVNTNTINLFLNNNITPVFCAITHTKNGQLLNTNADTVASEIAVAMSTNYKSHLHFVFEYPGVLSNIKNTASVIPHITFNEYEKLIQKGIITGGMLPKLHNCFNALEKGVQKVKIGNVNTINSNGHTTLSL